jgi:tRNA nucleotidyltransferase/poly(A) polymerase
MKLSELLIAIDKVASDKGLSKPYIVGGLTRDKLLDRIDQINDVDITTGDRGIHFLAREIAQRLSSHPNFSFEVMENGYSKITVDGFKLDFSSNFKVPGIDAILQEVGIAEPTEMQKELYSRDFTCNAALMTLDFKKVVDPTGVAVPDINEKVVRTLLPPRLTLGYDNNRIVRVIYLAAKLGFEVDPSIKDWIREHPQLIANSRPDYISGKLKKAAEYNPEIAGNLLTELGLWKYVPLIPELIEYQKEGLVRGAAKKTKRKKKKKKGKSKKRVDLDVRPYPNPLFTNYDYGGPEGGSEVGPGTGLYQGSMGKYKSVSDFLEKARKRKYRKAALADIIDKMTEND